MTIAEGVIVKKKKMAELDRKITCAICQEHYTEPKLLPCSHYFCKDCILKLSLRAGAGKSFSCPECQEEIVLPGGSVDKLQTAFFINRIQGSIVTLEEAHGKVVHQEFGTIAEESFTKKCPTHKEPLIAYCFDCGSLICSHYMIKNHNGHKAELSKEAAPDTRKKLMEKLKPLKKLKVSLTHAVVEVQTTRCELEAQGISVANNIKLHI